MGLPLVFAWCYPWDLVIGCWAEGTQSFLDLTCRERGTKKPQSPGGLAGEGPLRKLLGQEGCLAAWGILESYLPESGSRRRREAIALLHLAEAQLAAACRGQDTSLELQVRTSGSRNTEPKLARG